MLLGDVTLFDRIASSDLKLRVLLGASAMAFAPVFGFFAFELRNVVLGVVFGATAAVAMGVVVAKQLF
jgi:hypothetical protein